MGLGFAVPVWVAELLGKVFGLVLLVTLVAATHARYRIDQAIRFFASLLVVALVALILATYGY